LTLYFLGRVERPPPTPAFWRALVLKDFKAFIMRGNVVDLAVGVIIGAAFGAIVKSLVDDMLMPVLGLATGGLDFSSHFLMLKAGAKIPPPYTTPAEARAAGAVTFNYGSFINSVLTFLIVAFCVFLLIQAISKLHHAPATAPSTKDCPYCKRAIPLGATRCPECTSQLA
jgi:large conductance mechanosensitive channel